MKVHFKFLTFEGSIPPGIIVPSFEQKQCGRSQLPVSHFKAKSIGASVIGAGVVAIGPHRASFLKVQNLLISSKYKLDGHLDS